MRSARFYEFIRFCVVGGIAFCVDAAVLELLILLGASAAIARMGSIAVALHVSYLLHGRFTYRIAQGYTLKRWRAFLVSNTAGAAINYGLFMLLNYLALGATAEASRLVALLIATAVTMLFNYWANRRFAFASGRTDA